MRVLLFRMLCDTGGVSSSMLLLGREMARRGIDYEYWFCKPSTRLPEFQETGRATLGPLSKLAARLDRGAFDIVQMTASDPAAELVAMMARGAKVVVSARGALADIWDRGNCFAYTAISRNMADVNQPYTDVEIEIVRNAIDLERFSPDPLPPGGSGGRPIVAFVGRTTAVEKDFPRFTRIASRLVGSGARIWIADPHEASWEKLNGEPVERVPVERWGRVPFADIPAFYRAVAASGGIVLMTSRTEGFGNVAPEAAACGARVLAPAVMGLSEAIIPGVTGTLFPPNATDDEVAALAASLMARSHDLRECAEAARAEFSPSVMMDGYVRIYERREQLLRSRSPVPPDEPGMEVLRKHLAMQRRWRGLSARQAAADFARAGQRDNAVSALRMAFRTEPSQFAKPAALRQLLSTVGQIALPRARQ
jgi:hypothetical protein